MNKLLSAAVLTAALAAPAHAQNVIQGLNPADFSELKWGATAPQVAAHWRERPLAVKRESGITRLSFLPWMGMETWTVAVHDQHGFVQAEALSAASVTGAACELQFRQFLSQFQRAYPGLTPSITERNDAGTGLCEAVRAGRGEARYRWTDAAGTEIVVEVNRDGRVAFQSHTRPYRDWLAASGAPAAAPASAALPQRLGLTAAAFRAIRPGMSLEEVNALVGFAGTQTSTTDIGGRRSAGYKWQRGGEFMIVTFMDGRASQTMQAGLDTQSAPGRTATLAKYNQVQEGMTLEEVSRIMGGPGNFTGFIDIVGTMSEGYSWKGASLGTLMTASFRGGRLTTRMQFGLR
ncbi:MAG TPA: hypothetical protein VK420_14095 [Longimicrobium sp.]|nr:hypothetical protein [Longimicrobium sp.]